MKRKLAVIPAFEPDESLIDIASALSDNGIEVIIVNDGSSSDYDEIFRAGSEFATVLSYKKNQGKGHALKYAYKHILKHYSNPLTIVTADADGQHKLEDINRVLTEASHYPSSIVIGSRVLDKTCPFRSRFGNALTRSVFKISTGCRVYDTQSGLRAFDSSMLPFMLDIEGDRYEYEMNVLLTSTRESVSIREIPIETVYRPGNSSSHFNPLLDSYKIYREIVLFSASSLLSFFIDFSFYSFLSVILLNLPVSCSVSIANIGARIVSSFFNFSFNRNIVFKNKESILNTAIQYFLLVAAILAANTLCLNILVNSFLLNRFLAKIICEILFFLISWSIQHFFIFKKKKIILSKP